MQSAQAYQLALELETVRFIKKCREREARARFTNAPVLTGFDQFPEPPDYDRDLAVAFESRIVETEAEADAINLREELEARDREDRDEMLREKQEGGHWPRWAR